jgi:GAF domain-containing protein
MKNNMNRKLKQLSTLIELSYLVNSTLDIKKIIRRSIEAASSLLNAESGSLLLIDQETGELFFEVALGEKSGLVKKMRLAKGRGIAGWVADTSEPLIVQDVQADPRFFKGADEKSSFRTRNMICVPVKTKDGTIGVLQAINKKEGIFDEEDKEGIVALSNQVAIAIENARLYFPTR